MAVVTSAITGQATRNKRTPDTFTPPNLLLTVLAVSTFFFPQPEGEATRRQHQPQAIIHHRPIASPAANPFFSAKLDDGASVRRLRPLAPNVDVPNLLVSTLASGPPPPFFSAKVFDEGQATRRQRQDRNQIYARRLAPGAGGTPFVPTTWETTLRRRPAAVDLAGINLQLRPPAAAAQDPFKPADFTVIRRSPRPRVSNYSLNLSSGQDRFFTDAGEGPFNYDFTIPRRLRSLPTETAYPNLLTSTLIPTGVQAPFKVIDFSVEQRKSRQRHINYSQNLSLGLDQFFTDAGRGPFNYDWHIQRRARPLQQEAPYPNLILSTLIIPPGTPVKASWLEQEPATRRRQPLTEHPAQAFPARIPTGNPVKNAQLEQETATNRRRPRPQEESTSLYRRFAGLVDARGQFTYDFTETWRKARPNANEPVFRNFLTTLPPPSPFFVDHQAQEPPPRRRPVPDRPTLDINIRPLIAAIKPIGALYFEPSPRPRQSVDRYTFLHAVNVNLIGKDTFFNGPGRGPFNYDWKIPFRRLYIERNEINDLGRVPHALIRTSVTGQVNIYHVLGEDRRYRIPISHRRYKLKLASRTHHIPIPPERDA